MAKYQAYAEYKDSGVEWLGEIPSHWDLRKFKHHFRSAMGETILGADLIEDGKLPVYSATEGDHFFGYVNSSSVVLEKGDFVIPARGNSIGFPKLVVTTSTCSQTTIYAKMHKKIHSKFTFYYLLGCKPYLFQFVQTAIPQITVEEVKNNHLVHPSLEEQIQIANFLDHETAKIDHLIEKQQQLIELLKEKRQAVISHAVTKGLDPNVPMKDSGVAWLGEVPEHWVVSKLKYIKSHGHNAFVDGPFGSNLKSEHFVEDGDVYVIESNFATTGNLEPSNLKKITTKHFETICRSEAKGGDIIIAKIGARFGSSSILPILDKKAVVSGNSLKLTVNCKICDVNYANKLLQHLKNEGAIDDGVNGSAQPALSLGGLNTLPFLLPPLDEQIKIIQSLDLKVSKIDQVISQAKKQILLMQERRTALISAAVTGKIDVRHWQAPMVAEADTELSA
ncbi:MAG: restriction endonuclease subunit S [Acinetobacter sp.]|uniref:restriction endonuclease subunit S n=1 Tax=Acinetobacter sp. TaxID=472 RepID=UPI000FADEBB6|nr:restriction endonuclease subunit S [Acinetobacter sp.]RUP40704.1 MAG: restriction endonuclease subunit S [Acinetobacter sp.]